MPEKETTTSSMFNIFFNILMLPISLVTELVQSAGESLSGLIGAGGKAKGNISQRMRR